jgi:Protein of unknown function (DUF2867)
MRNVHERVLAADVERVAPLLAGLGGPDDRLFPTPLYAPLTLDEPVAPGVTGANGGVRLHVSAYEPGRRVELTTEPGQVYAGTLTWQIEPAGPGRTRMRHLAEGRVSGVWRLLWPLVRVQHDHCIEHMLDRAEAAVGSPPAVPVRDSLLVRWGKWADAERARPVPVPATPLLATALPRVDHADAVAVVRRPGMPADPQVWADALFHDVPRWVGALMGVRDSLVGLVGIARGGPGSFTTVARRVDEVLLGSDEEHLDFRASVLVERDRVVLSTVVTLHGRRGRAYFAPVLLVHPVAVRAMLTRAAHRLSRGIDLRGGAEFPAVRREAGPPMTRH